MRHVFVVRLSEFWRLVRGAATPAPLPPRTEKPNNSDALHRAPIPDLPAISQPIPPRALAKNAAGGTIPKKSENAQVQNRSPRIESPPPSDSVNKSKAARRRQMQKMTEMIEKLQRENVYLRKQLAANKEVGGAKRADEIVGAEHSTAYDQLLAAYGLPEKTTASKGGWTKELKIVYAQERDAFCDAFQEKYTEEERNRFAKAIRLFAQEGPQRMHNSLETKRPRRELPGISRGANYSRASDNLRFTWKQIGDDVCMLGVFKHTSGHAHTLKSVK